MSDASPYAPSAAIASEPTPVESPPRWLAAVASVITAQPFLGAGLWLLGRRRRAVGWAALGVLESAAMIAAVRAGAPRLYLGAVVLMVLSVLAAFLDTCTARREGKGGSAGKAVVAIVALFAVSRLTVFATRLWGVEGFQSPAASMTPTLLVGDHFIVSKGKRAARGDVITFKYPLGPETDYVKRVAAVGGDTVEIRQDVVYVNGTPWNEKEHLQPDDQVPIDMAPVKVPPGTVYVLGDNRHNSVDSRHWGTVPIENIKGRAMFIYWSSPKAGPVRWDRVGKIIR